MTIGEFFGDNLGARMTVGEVLWRSGDFNCTGRGRDADPATAAAARDTPEGGAARHAQRAAQHPLPVSRTLLLPSRLRSCALLSVQLLGTAASTGR